MFNIVIVILSMPILFLTALFYLPSWIMLVGLVLIAWVYRTRILFWFPITFSMLFIIFLVLNKFDILEFSYNSNFYMSLAGAFYVVMTILLPIAGVIISKKKDKKIDKIFYYSFLINFILLWIMSIIDPTHFVFAGV